MSSRPSTGDTQPPYNPPPRQHVYNPTPRQHLYNPTPRQHYPNRQLYGNNEEYYRPRGGLEHNNNQQFRPRQHLYNPAPRQHYQSNRPRNTKPLDFRKWEYAKPEPPTDCAKRFTILSYNILADYLATTHRGKLYYHIPRQFLDWQWRKRSIAFELGLWSADILCFQEVDKFEELEELLKPRGYTGIWKMRTGDPVDGCAIFWRTSRFKLLYEESIEFNKYGLRDNVAQICVMEQSTGCISNNYEPDSTTSQRPHNKIVVCNIHVLFNPKRGEIKLGQVRELLHRADAVSKLWDEAPVVLCGDFNSTPKSPLYNFIEEQKLDLTELPRYMVSGQASTPIAPQIASNHPRVQHFTGPAGDSLATNRNGTADIGSLEITENAGQANSMLYEPPEVSFDGKNDDGDDSSGETLKDKEQVLSDIKKDGSLCDLDVSGQITSVYLEGKSSYSTSKISTSESTTEESNLENIPEPTECGSEEIEHVISVSSQVADKWQNLSPANLRQVSSSENLDRSLPNVVLGGDGEYGNLDEDYGLQDGASNAPDSEEVQIAPGELNSSFEEPSSNGILDDTPVEIVEDNSLEKFMYDPSAWTPEEMRTATGNADCKVVEHPIKLKSTYAEIEQDNSGTRDSSGEPLVTSYHRRFQGTVDYIWRSEGLQTVRVLAPIPKSAMAWTPGFPTKKWGSDHIALVSELAFVKDGSAQNIGGQ
ncbi:hypothetical protein Leryth_000645 [Lithospermum erythrorhizon]|nr:hypothetical protein Leryth_000645 [Lithospermum erythrorhizon]